MAQVDMTPAEFRGEIARIRKMFGRDSWVSVGVALDERDGGVLSFRVYTSVTTSCIFHTSADDFRTLLANITTGWANTQIERDTKTVKAIALEIIRLTAEFGTCTEAALRGSLKYSESEIARLGERAVETANQMAANGPFSIARIVGNGAPELADLAPKGAAQ